jgi:hypothetical protein
MRSSTFYWTASTLTFLLFSIASPSAQRKNTTAPETPAAKGTIEGLVRDISCPIQNKKASATTFNLRCALDCAKQGSPLIILTKDGLIYTPISSEMPDKDQRPLLMPFVGKYVKATGDLFERGGAHAIAISEIKEMKDIHLVTDAK